MSCYRMLPIHPYMVTLPCLKGMVTLPCRMGTPVTLRRAAEKVMAGYVERTVRVRSLSKAQPTDTPCLMGTLMLNS